MRECRIRSYTKYALPASLLKAAAIAYLGITATLTSLTSVIPILFELGPIKIYSFGLMMGVAFIVASTILAREFSRKGMPPPVAGNITLIALVAGVVGAKLFSIFENFDRFLADWDNELFAASGLTFYGGLVVAIFAIWLYLRKKELRFLRVADAAAPALILAYGIGRIGCQLAGDGDYGVPSDLPWAMAYPNGTVPTDIPVHPAPVYETLTALLIFAVLWSMRKRPMATGMLFAWYLILAGLERLLVEFIRLNPLYWGLSQAQWISIGIIIIGGVLVVKLRSAPIEKEPSVTKSEPSRKKRAATATGS